MNIVYQLLINVRLVKLGSHVVVRLCFLSSIFARLFATISENRSKKYSLTSICEPSLMVHLLEY